MDPATLIAYILGGLLTILIGGLAYWWYKKNLPIHNFIGWDFGANSAQPRRIKRLFGSFRFVRSDKSVVRFPVPEGYATPRQDGKGTMFFGDLNTGQLFKITRSRRIEKVSESGDPTLQAEAAQWEMPRLDFAHGIFSEKALSDGRVQAVVQGTRKDKGVKLEHILIVCCIIMGLIGIVIYQFSRAGA
jgi:hypothetical protein